MNGLSFLCTTLVFGWFSIAASAQAQTQTDLSLNVEVKQLNAHSGVLRIVIDNLGPDDLVLMPPTLPNNVLSVQVLVPYLSLPTAPYFELTQIIEGEGVCFNRGTFFPSPPPGSGPIGLLGLNGPVLPAGEQRICAFRYEINPRLGNAQINADLVVAATDNIDPDLSNNRQIVTLRGTAPVAIPVNRGIGILLPLLMLIGLGALYRRRRALSTL